MTDLLERLIEEAAKRGKIESERDMLKGSLDEAGQGLAKQAQALEVARTVIADLRQENREWRQREQEAVDALRDLFDATKSRGKNRDTGNKFRAAMLKAANVLESYVPF
jgi:hypothetical protein